LKRILFAILTLAIAASAIADPNPKLRELAPLAGHWTCNGTAFAFLGMPEHKTTATIDSKWTFNDYWLQFHFTEAKTAANPMPVEVEYHWGWDEQTKQFAATAVDNGGGHFNQTSPGWNGDAITFDGEMHIAGTTMKFHDVFTKITATKIMHRGEALIDGKWTKLDEETCTK
jgi:hypothetical protein